MLRAASLAVALAVALARPAAALDAVDLSRVDHLEELARLVERDGSKRLELRALVPPLPEGLAFAIEGNDVAKERAFRTSWRQAHIAACEAAVERATEIAGDALPKTDREKPPERRLGPLVKRLAKAGKKDAAAADASRTLAALAARYDEVLRSAGDEEKLFAAREKTLQRFLKRYDLGPRIARATARGTAVIDVELGAATWDVVRREVCSWRFEPLLGADGKPLAIGGKRIEHAERLQQGQVREALQSLTNEYFTVFYAKMEDEKRVDLIRITGVKLLFGTWWFLDHEDRIVAIRAQ